MNLHSSIRYPFSKYIIEEFSGAFYENDLTSLNRLLILYHNRYSFTLKVNDIPDFLNAHQQGLSEPDWFYFYFWGERRRRIRQVRHRTAFVLQQNRGLLETLLSRKDYSSEEAALETLQGVSDWLQTLSAEVVVDKAIDLNAWKHELALLIQQSSKSGQVAKSTLRTPVSGHFHELFAGKDTVEKQAKFNRLKEILLKHQWITSVNDSDRVEDFILPRSTTCFLKRSISKRYSMHRKSLPYLTPGWCTILNKAHLLKPFKLKNSANLSAKKANCDINIYQK
jgi:hypothetical protein